MKATDLMIGDWVHVYTKGNDRGVFTVDDELLHGMMYPNLFDIKPIPLTPGILEKNGFVKVFLESAYKLPDYRSDIWFSPSTDYFYFGFDDTAAQFNCQYVHELQHVLKLCRIEKEIIL